MKSSTASTTVLAEEGARVASNLTINVMNPYNVAETHRNVQRRAQTARTIASGGEREIGREALSAMDEAASTADGLGYVDPDGAP